VGIAVGCAIGIISTAWMRGETDMFLNAAANSGAGHLQLVPKGWGESRDDRLRITDNWQELLEEMRRRPEVAIAGAHAKADVLLGMGTRVQGGQLLGVDPSFEPKLVRYIKGISSGRYLQEGDHASVVIGAELARRLDSEVGDELVVSSVSPSGDINSALLVIEGIISTGSRSMDATILHAPLAQVMDLSGRAGISNITINVHEKSRIEELRDAFQKQVGDRAEALTWKEVAPELEQGRKGDEAFSNALIFVIVVLVLLGVTSAQLTSVLQRGREFSVLTAIGMSHRQLVRLVLVESVCMGVAGSLLGLMLAFPAVYYLGTVGVNFAELVGEDGMTMSGLLMEPVIRADLNWWIVPYGLFLGIVATLGAAIYPAWFTRRIDPVEALRGRG
jgi:ABC-type lipoprotein release transport system permease subunit